MQSEAGRNHPSPFDRLVIAMNAVGTLWVLLLVLLMNADALGRTLLSLPIAGAVEIVAISMALIVFCQLADTIRLGKLTRSDGFVDMWIAGGTRAGKCATASMEILGAVFMALIVVGTFPLMVKAYERGVYIGTRGVFSFPDWPIKAVVVLGAVAAGICFVVRAVRILSGKSPNPQ
jgi:TRAP-type mannitol/chloroaromatic compound transport system permease small subunit